MLGDVANNNGNLIEVDCASPVNVKEDRSTLLDSTLGYYFKFEPYVLYG